MKRVIAAWLLASLAACSHKPSTLSVGLQKGADTESPAGMFGLTERGSGVLDRVYPEVKHVPADWTDVKIYYASVDFPQAVYQAYKAGRIGQQAFQNYFDACALDTARYAPSPHRLFIAMAFGLNSSKDSCYLIDANGNADLADDEAMLYRDRRPVAVELLRKQTGAAAGPDTVWLEPVGMFNRMFLSAKESATATFTAGGVEYSCKVTPSLMRYGADATIAIATGEEWAHYRVGQYVRLGQRYYRIDSLSESGTRLSFTEDKEALTKPSLQVGFRPYGFRTVTTAGDTLTFPADFKGKKLLLDFWATGCGACRTAMEQSYPLLYRRYKQAGFEILAIADDSAERLEAYRSEHPMDWPTVADRDHNRELTELFQVRSFPTLYLVDEEGLIIADNRSLQGSALEATLRRVFPEVPAFTSCGPKDFAQLLSDNPAMQLLDVRTPQEHAAGAIRGARLLDVKRDDFARQAKALLDKSRPVAVYCRSGVRSRKAAWILVDQGFTVYNLDGGYSAWRQSMP